MKAKWIFIKILLGIGLLSFLISFSAQRNACRDISGLNVFVDHSKGNYFINDSLIRLILSKEELTPNFTALGNMNVYELEKTVDENSFVRKSQVYKGIEGNLIIEVEQETPIARINTNKEEFYLTETAKKIPLSNLYSANVILVKGKINDEDLEGLKSLIMHFSEDNLLKKHIIGIVKERKDSYNLIVNWGEFFIEFGSLSDVEEKLKKLKLFYNQFLNKVPEGYYEKISLKYNNQIVATKRIKDEE